MEIFTSLETRTQEFSMSLKQQGPLLPDEKYKSYDVKTLFTDVPVHETIDYILQEICVKEKITENIFQINHEEYITKINNRKDLVVELNLLQINWQRHNMWTPICQIFQHPYDQNRRRSF